MKKKSTLLIIITVLLIVIGIIWLIVSQTTNSKEDDSTNETTSDTVENYQELGSATLAEDKVFDGIKYTRNHLSTTDDSYATFTSVVFNETGQDIVDQPITIVFLDQTGSVLGEMTSEIENVKANESTMIYGIIEQDMSAAYDFKVEMSNP